MVEVEFDSGRIPYDALLKKALQSNCASAVYTRSDGQQAVAESLGVRTRRSDEAIRPDQDPKYYLSKSLLRFVPLTPLQASRANARLRSQTPVHDLLSPRQLRLLALVERRPEAGWTSRVQAADFLKAWSEAEAAAGRLPGH